MPTRDLPPALEFPTPPCPICHQPASYDEGFNCWHCGIEWPPEQPHHANGKWLNADAAQCTWAVQDGHDARRPFPDPERPHWRCYLHEGHPHRHMNPERELGWSRKNVLAFQLRTEVATSAAPVAMPDDTSER